MDLLKQELEKKRKLFKDDFGDRKFVKRGDIERKKLEHLREEEKREREQKLAKKASNDSQKSSDGTAKVNASGSLWKARNRSNLSSETEDAIDRLILPKPEVVRRLRMLKQPITLFGEDDEARLTRLKIILKSGDIDAEGELMEGQRNDFLRDMTELIKSEKHGRMDVHKEKSKVDHDTREGGSGSGGAPQEGETNHSGGEGVSSGQENDVDSKRMKSAFDDLCDEDRILVYFKRLLKEWEVEINERPESEKRTAKGKANTATFKQCARYIEPLFRMCRKKQLYDDIREALVSIVKKCRGRDYLAAMDEYIKLAIGNAPWPIGVTMVGIHERSAREKIHTNTVAHIMNDETTRKYLQSVKRLMTFSQRRYPAMPSKSVEYDQTIFKLEKAPAPSSIQDDPKSKAQSESSNGAAATAPEERLMITSGP